MKIKSITIEINGEDKALTMEQAKELYDVLGDVLQADATKGDVKPERSLRKDKVVREPVYIPMPYPVYPQPTIPSFPSPFYYKYSMVDTNTGRPVSGNAMLGSSVKLLGCTVQQ